jgi:hypothetical protein
MLERAVLHAHRASAEKEIDVTINVKEVLHVVETVQPHDELPDDPFALIPSYDRSTDAMRVWLKYFASS